MRRALSFLAIAAWVVLVVLQLAACGDNIDPEACCKLVGTPDFEACVRAEIPDDVACVSYECHFTPDSSAAYGVCRVDAGAGR